MPALSLNLALGNAGLLVTLVAASVGAASGAVALIGGNRRAVAQTHLFAWPILIGTSLSVAMMQRALTQRDYSIEFVQQVGSSTTPTLYNIAAMWSALAGSILLWVVVLAAFTAAVALRFRARRDDPLVAWALVVMYVVTTFFALISFGPASPFREGPSVPIGFDAPGPNPLLQNHILMAIHPPMLYLGYVGLTAPFAYALGSLVIGTPGTAWVTRTKRLTLLAWSFLTIGILLGGWWSDRKSTRLNSSHVRTSRMPSSA